MVLSNRVQTTLYRNWPKQLDALALALGLLTVPFIAPLLRRARRRPEREIDRVMPRMLPPCDLAVVARPEIRAVLLREAAILSIGMLRASIQDMAVGIRDWDFELRDIDVPVHVWHGDLDRNIPLSHGPRSGAPSLSR
jgi:pimeloyl-ACP methyl ester carboxylesterase